MTHFKFHYSNGLITAAVVAEDASVAWIILQSYPSIIARQPLRSDLWEIVEAFEVEALDG